MNFILDATLGMLFIWMGVKVVSRIVEHKQYTILVFGEYGRHTCLPACLSVCLSAVLSAVLSVCLYVCV